MADHIQLIHCKKISEIINPSLIRCLVDGQFPQWKDLPIRPVKYSNWRHKDFYLGDQMLIRVPKDSINDRQLQKEHHWLAKLAPHLPLKIPELLALGEPTKVYPWHWSIDSLLGGAAANSEPIDNLCDFASALARFILALQRIDATDGPLPDSSFACAYKKLEDYEYDVETGIGRLGKTRDVDAAAELWEAASHTSWDKSPVWFHGAVSVDNLLVEDGQLCAVNNFSSCAVGDPARDLTIAWTLFSGESREVFCSMFDFDPGTWLRARAWVLGEFIWAAGDFLGSHGPGEEIRAIRIIEEVLRKD